MPGGFRGATGGVVNEWLRGPVIGPGISPLGITLPDVDKSLELGVFPEVGRGGE